MNALWTLISGKRLPLNDPELLKLVDVMDRLTIQLTQRRALNAFPWLRFIAPKTSGWTEWISGAESLLAFLEKTIKPYLGSYNVEGIADNL